MPTFTAPGASDFEMRTGEPAASVANVFRQPVHSSSGDASSAVRYHEFGGVEILGSFSGTDADGWPLAGTITTIRYYVLGTPGDPASRQLLYEVTGGAWDVAAFMAVADQDLALFALLSGGNDRLEGGAGDDDLVGGAGDDLYIFNSTFDWAHEAAGGGYDTVQASASFTLSANVERLVLVGAGGHTGVGNALDNEIVGNDDGNRLVGGLGDDQLDGGAGDDILIGGSGADILIGGEGDDTYHVHDGLDQIVEQWGDGFDRVLTWVDFTLAAGLEVEQLSARGPNGLRLTGNEMNNHLIGGVGDDILVGGDGDDLLSGRDGVDTMDGGAGNDRFIVTDAGDVLIEATGQGRDTAYLHVDYVLADGVEVEVLSIRTSAGAIVTGNDLANSIVSGRGDDVINGGGGSDTASFWNASAGVSARLIAGVATGDGTDQLIGIENLAGSPFNDRLAGDAADNELSGRSGNDYLYGFGGDDLLRGGDGDDHLFGGLGENILIGGQGSDTANYSRANVRTLIDLDGGIALGAGIDDLREIENAVGSNRGDLIFGSRGDNRLDGGDGDDDIGGGPGDDVLIGGAGHDYFFYDGPSGADVILDFTAGAGTNDLIALDPSWFTGFADVLANTADTASGALITTPQGTILLSGVTLAQLHEDDFLFCGCASAAAATELAAMRAGVSDKEAVFGPLVFPDAAQTGAGSSLEPFLLEPASHRVLMETWSDWQFTP